MREAEALVTRPPLTNRQGGIFNYIAATLHRKGRPPTLREIGEEFAISSPNGVMGHLRALEQKGYIRRDAGKSRAIEIVGAKDELLRDLEDSRILARAYGRGDLERRLESQISLLKKTNHAQG